MRSETENVLAVTQTAGQLLEALGRGCVRIEIAGAIRRRLRSARGIDFVAVPKVDSIVERRADGGTAVKDVHLLWDALDYFCDQPEHEGFIKRGEVLRSFMWRLVDGSGKVAVNVYTARPDDWGIKMLCHTGPEDFWFHVVGKLYAAGYQPREGRLVRLSDGQAVPTPTEQDVTELARMPYREPWQRDGNSRPSAAW